MIDPTRFSDWWVVICDRLCYREPSVLTATVYEKALGEKLTDEEFELSASHIFETWEAGSLPSPSQWIAIARELKPVQTYQLPEWTPPPISELSEDEQQAVLANIARIKAQIQAAVAQSPYKSSVMSSVGDVFASVGGSELDDDDLDF